MTACPLFFRPSYALRKEIQPILKLQFHLYHENYDIQDKQEIFSYGNQWRKIKNKEKTGKNKRKKLFQYTMRRPHEI